MYGGVWGGLHLLEYCEGGLVVGPQLEDVAHVEGGLLEVAVRLQDLPQLRRTQSAGVGSNWMVLDCLRWY